MTSVAFFLWATDEPQKSAKVLRLCGTFEEESTPMEIPYPSSIRSW